MTTSKIKSLHARQILDSRGKWTIEVKLESDKSTVTASIPHGKSVGSYEAACVSPELSVKFIEKKISASLIGKDPSKQEAIDQLLLKISRDRATCA